MVYKYDNMVRIANQANAATASHPIEKTHHLPFRHEQFAKIWSAGSQISCAIPQFGYEKISLRNEWLAVIIIGTRLTVKSQEINKQFSSWGYVGIYVYKIQKIKLNRKCLFAWLEHSGHFYSYLWLSQYETL